MLQYLRKILAEEMKEMAGDSEKKPWLPRNDELGVLYKISGVLKPSTISRIGMIPEFMEALESIKGNLSDNEVYEVLKTVAKEMESDGVLYRGARDTMNKVSRDVKGDSQLWHDLVNDEA